MIFLCQRGLTLLVSPWDGYLMNHYLKMILIFDDIAVKNGISATLEKKTCQSQQLLNAACGVLSWLQSVWYLHKYTKHVWIIWQGPAVTVFSSNSQDGFPIRIKAVNIINEPRIFKGIFAIIKPFLKEKMAERVTILVLSLTLLFGTKARFESCPSFYSVACVSNW